MRIRTLFLVASVGSPLLVCGCEARHSSSASPGPAPTQATLAPAPVVREVPTAIPTVSEKEAAPSPSATLQGGFSSSPKDGFRDLRWGSTPTPDMFAVSMGGDAVYRKMEGEAVYRRPSDKLSIGDVSVIAITYHYNGGRLYAVDVPHGFDENARLDTFLESVWGESLGVYPQPFFWKSEDTQVVSECAFKNGGGMSCSLRFSRMAALKGFRDADESRRREEEAAARKAIEGKAAKDL